MGLHPCLRIQKRIGHWLVIGGSTTAAYGRITVVRSKPAKVLSEYTTEDKPTKFLTMLILLLAVLRRSPFDVYLVARAESLSVVYTIPDIAFQD